VTESIITVPVHTGGRSASQMISENNVYIFSSVVVSETTM